MSTENTNILRHRSPIREGIVPMVPSQTIRPVGFGTLAIPRIARC